MAPKHGAKSPKDRRRAGSVSNAAEVPSFDEAALSSLTNKIEAGFRTAAVSKAHPQPDGDSVNLKLSGASIKVPQKIKEHGKRTENGKKRDAEGNVKQSVNGSLSNRKIAKDRRKDGKTDDSSILLQEILALGGTEEDMELVAGADSNEEDDKGRSNQPAAVDSKFTKELSKFVSGLGITRIAQEDASASGSSSEIDDIESHELDEVNDDKSILEYDTAVRPLKTSIAPRDKSEALNQKNSNRLIFEARPDWHAADLPELPDSDISEGAVRPEVVTALKQHAFTLLEADSNLYTSKHLSSTSSHRFLSTIMSSGTLSDKVSALTLVVQESPLHTTKSFESLLALAKKRSRGQAVTALGAIKDLLGVGVVLPSDRRLRSFENQPGLLGTLHAHPVAAWKPGNPLPGRITDAQVISWAYEDWLKETYFDVIQVLEGWCNDEVEFAKARAVTYVYELLREKPEQESNLLRLLVNKLGDPDKKIASRTSYLILQLQTTHPLMKPIIVRSIETELLLRPGQSLHARYYAINTLNQTILSGKEEDLARKLLNIYFGLFVTLLKKADVEKLPTGPVVNRKGQIQGGGGQMGKKAKEKAKKQDLAKQVGEEATEKMISAVLTGVNRAFPFAKSDDLTLEKHMDMLFKITHSSNFNTSIQALMLIQQLATSKHLAEERFYRTLYESLLDPRLINSSKHAMYLNLLFRALKNDLNVKRVKAFAKRLIQIITLHQPPFICGVLYLLRELEETFPGLKSLFHDQEEWDDVDEVFLDVSDGHVDAEPATESSERRRDMYDGRKRDPEHSNADKSCLWELLPFVTHFHPSVSMFAARLLSGIEMPAKPDLASHTLIHFLDRFVYRNAKAAAAGLRGSSIMQPLAGGDSQGVLVSNRTSQHGSEPVNSESFWRKNAEDVAVDEVFFHRYFSQLGRGKESSGKKKKSLQSSAAMNSGNEGSENEDEIWQALVESRPEVEGHSEDDSDLEMLDLDESEDDSSGTAGVDLESDGDEDAGFEACDGDSSEDPDGGSDNASFGEESDDAAVSDMDELFNKELEGDHRAEAGSEEKNNSRAKRRKLRGLPTFASAEEYAEMLEDNEDEDF